ncbi:Lysine-specific demethylase 4B [Phytophthora boehmeriae]|uniref:Lysine-specific demethylase 4B n=1 Tax=Phytophthora boehmeriae TaxID=109152 RepID=A0A8T1VM59_9STRA|nr:Lysine-specific demethylase 4B [Phytophthora boehmeriae]
MASQGRGASRHMSRQIGTSGSGSHLDTENSQSVAAGVAAEEDDGETDELTFTLPEMSKDGNDTGRTVRETWPTDHVMLLYMLSRYAVCARTKDEKESWIRQIPLLVLMYEGIAAGALNFDYAPAAMVIAQEGRPKRIWMNTTQDGKSAIDDLREANLINGLKLSTKDYHSVTAFQVSFRGLQLLAQVSKELKANVDAFIFAPKPYRRELLKIRYIPIRDPPDAADVEASGGPAWTFNKGSDKHLMGGGGENQEAEEEDSEFNEEGRFILESIGYFRYSGVTETEDVSYVSSPFVPQCVRSHEAYQQLSSNAHRALEAASGQSNIRDTLSEAIVLANPVCLVGEWIPFGSNQIVALNERLGSMDRCQGGLFTSLIDDRPTDTQFEVPPGLTEVRILDYDPVRYINFEAEINFPEDDGIVQVENFGIHLNVDGTIFYGIKVDAILDKRSDRISVDLLSRLLVDIHQDSSEIMDDLLSSYQTSLLDMVFLGDIANRGKFNMIMADQIDPFMPGLEYMDRGDFENELKQVLGDIHCAYDIGEDSVLIVGRDGMLIAGSASKRFEKVFISYFSLLCREMFLRSFFTRIFVLEELLKHIRELIFRAKEDPHHLVTIRAKLNQATNDLILFTDTLGYLLESLEFVKIPQKSPNASEEEESIFSYLDLKKQHHDILLRARDLEKLVHGAKYEIVNLRQMAEVLNTSELEDIFKTVEGNTKVLADSSLSAEQCGSSLELVQVLLAGSFAFTLLDRIPGGTLNVDMPKWVETAFAKPIIDVPLLFFVLNMFWMAGCIYLLIRYKRKKNQDEEYGRRTLRIKVNKSINIDAFETFLGTKVLDTQESVSQIASEVRRVVWKDLGLQACNDERAHPRRGVAYLKGGLSWKLKFKYLVGNALEKWWARLRRQHSSPSTIPMGNSVSPLMVDMGEGLLEPGIPLEMEVEYDSRYGFLLFVTFHFQMQDKKIPISQLCRNYWAGLKEKLHIGKRTAPRQLKRPQDESFYPRNETVMMEQQLMSWFAMEMKQHEVIKNAELFLSSL